MGQFLSKGQLVVEGRLQTRQWDDDAGKHSYVIPRAGASRAILLRAALPIHTPLEIG